MTLRKYLPKFWLRSWRKHPLRMTVACFVALVLVFSFAQRFVDYYFVPHTHVFSGVNYYPFPIQVEIGEQIVQVASFETYQITTEERSLRLMASKLDGTELALKSTNLENVFTVTLDIWSPGSEVVSCGLALDVTNVYYGSIRQPAVGGLVSAIAKPQNQLTFNLAQAPASWQSLDNKIYLTNTVPWPSQVMAFVLSDCRENYSREDMTAALEAWNGYNPEVTRALFLSQAGE
jgi:hypothetical protein